MISRGFELPPLKTLELRQVVFNLQAGAWDLAERLVVSPQETDSQ